jgi:UDP:flavonoid glycosyltransferase YjiC (YdhE family)
MGDTFPFLFMGRALADRGHEVLLLGNEDYRAYLQDDRIKYIPIISPERFYREREIHRRGTDQISESVDFFHWCCAQIEPVYHFIREQYEPGETVVCGQSYAMGARVAQIRHQIPLATVHVQPFWMRSSFDMPPLPTWMTRVAGPALQALIDLVIDHTFGRDIKRYCQPLGVYPTKRMMRTWWNSPELILGLWPEWYSQPQRDWPTHTVLAGFPIPSEMKANFESPDLDEFLAGGEPPIVFSRGSSDRRADQFLKTSIEVARNLRRRALFISPASVIEKVDLPEGMKAFSFVPFDAVLSRSAAHVHHGGIGTIALSLRAGVPQLTVPAGLDQPDNSERLRRLGVSDLIRPNSWNVKRGTARLGELLGSTQVRSKCAEYRHRIKDHQPWPIVIDAIERLASDHFSATSNRTTLLVHRHSASGPPTPASAAPVSKARRMRGSVRREE